MRRPAGPLAALLRTVAILGCGTVAEAGWFSPAAAAAEPKASEVALRDDLAAKDERIRALEREVAGLEAAQRPAAVVELRRPPVARTLLKELFAGMDPMEAPPQVGEEGVVAEEGMTHVTRSDIDMVLAMAAQPVTFWLELGSYEGGSAILAAQRAANRTAEAPGSPETSVVAVDTFLGDARVLWLRPEDEKRRLLRPDGTVSLFDRFKANVRRSGQADAILPMPATSITALRVMASLAKHGTAPQPQVIYLDSAHEEGEVLLELRLAWATVSPGGIIFGDDWVLPDPDEPQDQLGGGAVQRDVLRFAKEIQADLDETLGAEAQPLRTLGRARPGLFVSYNSFQWFMRKLPDAAPRAAMAPSASAEEDAGFDCWSSGFSKANCCDVRKFGPGGDPACWDIVFTFDRCCPGGAGR